MAKDKVPSPIFPILPNSDKEDHEGFVKIGVHVVSNLPLQVSLYFNLIFFPFWFITYATMVPLKFYHLTRLYQFIFSLAFAAVVVIEALRLYVGYNGNLREKISELAGFWLITVLLQTPLQMFLLLSTGLAPSLLESVVQTIMCLFLFTQLVFGILALKNAAKHSVLSFHLTGTQCKERHGGLGTLQRCWGKLLEGLEGEDNEDYENLVEIVKEIPGCDTIGETEVNEWIIADDSVEFTDQDLVDAVLRPPEIEDDDSHDTVHRVTAQEGFNALEVALQYVEQCKESTPADVLHLKRWRDIAARKRFEGQTKQKKITDFF